MPTRPPMHVRDASGRQVSLLNDEPGAKAASAAFAHSTYAPYDEASLRRANSYVSASSASPRTPDLSRADSYDSQMSAFSPLTPTSLYDYGRQSYSTSSYPDPSQLDQRPYGSFSEKPQHDNNVRSSFNHGGSSSYDEDLTDGNSSERQGNGKRYPCRYKTSHNCDKTFTTSGHASRHSKIHTAEKAVLCSFPGCIKKFTRADNMKQHLETHYKERSRASQKVTTTSTKLSMPAGVRKHSSTPNRPSSRTAERVARDAAGTYDSMVAFNGSDVPSPLPSPVSPLGTLDMNSFQNALPTSSVARMPMHQRTTSATYRLDALASIASDSR